MGDRRSDYRVVGLESIRLGLVLTQTAVTYMIGTGSMQTLGNFVPDSAHLLIDPDDVTNFMVEDKSEVDCQIKTPGLKTLEFAVRDMGPTILVYAMGGSVSGATVYMAPQTAQVIKELCVEVVTVPIGGKQYKIEMPRTSLAVGGDLRFGKSETGTLTFSSVVMQPYSSISPLKMTLVAA